MKLNSVSLLAGLALDKPAWLAEVSPRVKSSTECEKRICQSRPSLFLWERVLLIAFAKHVLHCDFQVYCNYLRINIYTQDFTIVMMHNVVSKYVKQLAFDSMQCCAWSTA